MISAECGGSEGGNAKGKSAASPGAVTRLTVWPGVVASSAIPDDNRLFVLVDCAELVLCV